MGACPQKRSIKVENPTHKHLGFLVLVREARLTVTRGFIT